MLTAKPITLSRQNSVITLIFLDIFTFLWYHFKYDNVSIGRAPRSAVNPRQGNPARSGPRRRLPIAFASVNAIPISATCTTRHLANPQQRRQIDRTGFVKMPDRCPSSLKPQRTYWRNLMLVPMAEKVREAQERLMAEFDNDFQR